jgi:beta-lysine 5,6-aminomutase alpha subunit
MATVPVDEGKVRACRELAANIARDVQGYIDLHTSVGVERTILRAYGAEGADAEGAPLVNLAVDRYKDAGLLDRGILYFVGRALLAGSRSVQEAAEALAYGDLDTGEGGPSLEEIREALRQPTIDALARIDGARDQRDALRASFPEAPAPHKYVIVATGNIWDDALQAKAAAFGGADIVAVIRATAQSLLDYVPDGATTEGYGGTFATQENFKIIRKATNEAAKEYGRYIQQTNYSSGLCMAEIAWMAAVEGLDMLLNDAMYGILFRDINPCRNFVDQYVARRIIGRAGIIINTGEDNYLTTADAVEKAHTVLASQFINEAFAHNAGVSDEKLGLGHAYEINPTIENSFLYELSQAQLIRQIFPQHPIKWMPPTKFKTGDVFQSHVHDAMFNLVGVMTNQSIELLGMFSEAIHNPMLMDRFLSLKATKYVFNTAKDFGDEIEFKKDGIVAKRAVQVLDEALELLQTVEKETIWGAIARGDFADVKRLRDGGKGYKGVVARHPEYLNPLLSLLEGDAKGGEAAGTGV